MPHEGIVERAGRRTLSFADPEGQRLHLMDGAGSRTACRGPAAPCPSRWLSVGWAPITLTVAREQPTVEVLTQVLGFTAAGNYAAAEDGKPVRVFAVGPGGPGAEVHLAVRRKRRAAAWASAACTISPSARRTPTSISSGSNAWRQPACRSRR